MYEFWGGHIQTIALSQTVLFSNQVWQMYIDIDTNSKNISTHLVVCWPLPRYFLRFYLQVFISSSDMTLNINSYNIN